MSDTTNFTTSSCIRNTREVDTLPATYRLAKTKTGELVLQGQYMWREGWDTYGFEWRDIPTVDMSFDTEETEQ